MEIIIDKEIIDLIIQTKSIDDNEKQWWLDNLPSLSTSTIDRLKDILLIEKNKLEEIEKEYNETILELNKNNY